MSSNCTSGGPAAESELTPQPRFSEVTPTVDGKLVFFYDWCKHCGLCVVVCPTGAIAEDESGKPYMAENEKCRLCSLCWRICPDFAIIPNPNWEGK